MDPPQMLIRPPPIVVACVLCQSGARHHEALWGEWHMSCTCHLELMHDATRLRACPGIAPGNHQQP
jgi:hypothetical protein